MSAQASCSEVPPSPLYKALTFTTTIRMVAVTHDYGMVVVTKPAGIVVVKGSVWLVKKSEPNFCQLVKKPIQKSF